MRENDPFALNHSPFDACAVAVNNMHLLHGMLGRPGAGILQMNGQPTAQNNRETGADGDLPGFRNWQNEQHVAALAELWDVDPIVIPDWAEPTHAMQIFRYVEQRSINSLWVAGTNPAVSLPELSRIRTILGKESLFLWPFTDRYGSHPSGEPERLHADGLSSTRSGGLGLLRDLHDLYLLASYLEMAWMVVGQAAKGGRDQELIRTVEDCDKEMESQQQWLMTRMKAAAPQSLLVAD